MSNAEKQFSHEPVELTDDDGKVIARYKIGEYFEYEQPFFGTWHRIIKLIRGRIIVKMAPTIKRTAGGLIIPDSAQRRPMVGQVILAASGTYRDWNENLINLDEEVKPGDNILFQKVSGSPIYWGTTQEVWHFRVGSILAHVEGDFDPDGGVGISWKGEPDQEFEEELEGDYE